MIECFLPGFFEHVGLVELAEGAEAVFAELVLVVVIIGEDSEVLSGGVHLGAAAADGSDGGVPPH